MKTGSLNSQSRQSTFRCIKALSLPQPVPSSKGLVCTLHQAQDWDELFNAFKLRKSEGPWCLTVGNSYVTDRGPEAFQQVSSHLQSFFQRPGSLLSVSVLVSFEVLLLLF